MARSLANKTNVDPPDSDYPYAKARDNDGSQNGTPVNEELLGDIIQFFERLMDQGGFSHNELPDNDYSGFQYFQAILKSISLRVGTYSTDNDLGVGSNNLNNYIYAGIFQVNSSFTNKPTGMSTSLLYVSGIDSNITQKITDLTNSAEWIRTYTGTVWSAWTMIKLAEKLVSWSGWNMDTTATFNVAHGLASMAKLRSVAAFVNSNVGNFLPLNYMTSDEVVAGGVTSMDNTNVVLRRRTSTGGDPGFDSAGYNNASGYVVIYYVPS